MDEQHKDLSKHRFHQAKRSLASAKLLMNAGDCEGAANRTYYAVFHGMRSILVLVQRNYLDGLQNIYILVGEYKRSLEYKNGPLKLDF